MQAECDDVWRQMALAKLGKGDASDEMGDFGFIGPWRETMKLCQDVVLSDYKVWPEAGGWFDQPEWFRQDFTTFMKRFAWQMHVVQLELAAGGNNDSSLNSDDLYDVPDWSEMG